MSQLCQSQILVPEWQCTALPISHRTEHLLKEMRNRKILTWQDNLHFSGTLVASLTALPIYHALLNWSDFGPSIAEHTAMVINQYLKYFYPYQTPIVNDRLMRLLLIHDLGKSFGRDRQFEATGALIENLPGSFIDRDWARILLSGDWLGAYLTQRHSLSQTLGFLKSAAAITGYSIQDIFNDLVMLYQADSSAYSRDGVALVEDTLKIAPEGLEALYLSPTAYSRWQANNIWHQQLSALPFAHMYYPMLYVRHVHRNRLCFSDCDNRGLPAETLMAALEAEIVSVTA